MATGDDTAAGAAGKPILARDLHKAQIFDLTTAPAHGLDMVALTISRRGGRRRTLLLSCEGAVDLVMRIVGVLRQLEEHRESGL